MRNGDAYKIKLLSKSGVSDSDICHRFRNSYKADEVMRFIPGKPVEAVEAPKPKAKRKSRAKAKT